MGVWGQAQYIIDDVIYGLTSKTTAAEKVPSATVYLFKYDTSSKESSVGSTSITSTSITSKPAYKKGNSFYFGDFFHYFKYNSTRILKKWVENK